MPITVVFASGHLCWLDNGYIKIFQTYIKTVDYMLLLRCSYAESPCGTSRLSGYAVICVLSSTAVPDARLEWGSGFCFPPWAVSLPVLTDIIYRLLLLSWPLPGPGSDVWIPPLPSNCCASILQHGSRIYKGK